jgi:signal transduction histidine kinase/DNA-binding response OmpR family regulator
MANRAITTERSTRLEVDGGLVWVLEDSPLEAEMARRAIAPTHNVEIFADSPGMLERIANGARPDALVLDCQLPTLTGLEVCRFLREQLDEMELPILMLTVEGHRSDLVEGLVAGANDYLTKPYHVSELQARVNTLVRTRFLHASRARRARELALTAEVGAMLTRGLDTAAQNCAAAIARHLDATLVAIWTTDEQGRLDRKAFAGTVDAKVVVPPREGREGRQGFVRFDQDTDSLIADDTWRNARRRTFVEMPLVVETHAAGAMAIATRRRLDPEELQALAPLADLVALGLDRMLAERERAALLAREQRARTEAETANKSKDEFLAMLSHELRGPLNAIAGWVHMLRAGLVPPTGTERALATIERNTRAQTQLVEDLLDVSRIVSGKLTIDDVLVDLGQAMEGVVESLRPMANDKKIVLVAEVDRVGEVRGDPARLRQVATNLVTNSMKFTPAGGRVTVSVRVEGTFAVLRVEDTGQGIEAGFLPHVFERFRQADGSKARRHGGLGLGLAIVHHITTLHGGSVSVSSEGIGKGATFTVKLPLAEGTRVPDSAIRTMTNGHDACSSLRVIVVDDDPEARELVSTVLAEHGTHVRAAVDVEEALALFQAETPDAVVTDLGMPGADGYELLKRIRALPENRGAHVPVIAVTAYARTGGDEQILRAGFDRCFAKPFDPNALVSALAAIAGQRA